MNNDILLFFEGFMLVNKLNWFDFFFIFSENIGINWKIWCYDFGFGYILCFGFLKEKYVYFV